VRFSCSQPVRKDGAVAAEEHGSCLCWLRSEAVLLSLALINFRLWKHDTDNIDRSRQYENCFRS